MQECRFQISKSMPDKGMMCYKSLELSLREFFLLKRAIQKYAELVRYHGPQDIPDEFLILLDKIEKLDLLEIQIF